MPTQERFAGDLSLCKGLVLQCSLYLACHGGMSEAEKITLFMNLISDKALKLATAVREIGGEPVASYAQFTDMFHRVLDHSPGSKEVGELLLTLCQSPHRVSKFALEFHTIIAGSGLNDAALKAAF